MDGIKRVRKNIFRANQGREWWIGYEKYQEGREIDVLSILSC